MRMLRWLLFAMFARILELALGLLPRCLHMDARFRDRARSVAYLFSAITPVRIVFAGGPVVVEIAA